MSSSEELLQITPHQLERYRYYKLGATNLSTLQREGIIGHTVPQDFALNRPDGLIVAPYSNAVKAYIEYKPPQRLRTAAQIARAINQELRPAASICKLLIVTDGSTSYWINTLSGHRVKTVPGQPQLPVMDAQQIASGTISREHVLQIEEAVDLADVSLTATNDILSPPDLIDPSGIARTIWQKIWINTGKEPEKCLYNVVELFVFKFLSDIGVLRAHNTFDYVYHKIVKNGTLEEREEALRYYATNCRPEIMGLFPEGEDGTTIINGTIFINEAGAANPQHAHLFCEVLHDLRVYSDNHGSFRYIKKEFKTRLYESFLRQQAGIRFLGQYFTPRNVVAAMVAMSPADRLPEGARVCDPFCGVGGFILELIAAVPHIYSSFAPDSSGAINPSVSFTGYDKGTDEKEDERTIILAKANMLIYFADLLAKHNSATHLRLFSQSVFNSVFRLVRTNIGTFGINEDDPYDLIMTNPPYVTSGSQSLKRAITDQGLAAHYTSGGRGTEALAIEWIVRNLKPGGTALVIVPDGLLSQQSVLDYVLRECIVRGIVSLPTRTFYSTPKKTYIIILDRKRPGQGEQSDPVFTYLVSEIGETRDANRWKMDRNDLDDAALLYKRFRAAPTAPMVASERCKTLPYEHLRNLRHWMVDRQWTDAELQELGVAEEQSVVTDAELLGAIGSVRDDLSTHSINTSSGPPTRYIEVALRNRDLFSLEIGRRLYKRDMAEDGTPAYSANVSAPFGYVSDTSSVRVHTGPALLWGIDGIFDWGYVPDGVAFIATDHCGVLKIVGGGLVLRYLVHELRVTRGAYGFDRTYRANLANIAERVTVRIPVSSNGMFDEESQERIADRYEQIANLQSTLLERASEIAMMQYEWPHFRREIEDDQ